MENVNHQKHVSSEKITALNVPKTGNYAKHVMKVISQMKTVLAPILIIAKYPIMENVLNAKKTMYY